MSEFLKHFSSNGPYESVLLEQVRHEVAVKLAFGVHYIFSTLVEGDIAEFGTKNGDTACAIAEALGMLSQIPKFSNQLYFRKLHLFDSFEGLPVSPSSIDQASLHVKTGMWEPGKVRGASCDAVIKRLETYLPLNQMVTYEGWFNDTLPKLPDDTKFAMVHLDCDLYDSTMTVLDTCFSKNWIQEGTALFFDDWNCNRASPQFGERKAWADLQTKFAINYSDCGEYGYDGHKFIIHSYQLR